MTTSPRFDLDHVLAALARQDEVEIVGRGPRLQWWDERDFADGLGELRAGGALERAVLAALGPRPEAWLELPLHVALQWEAELDAYHAWPVGRLGGLCMRSLLDAWYLRDDPGWRAPWGPEGASCVLLLDIDDYHGNGDFTVAALMGDQLRFYWCDGHVFFPLADDPLRLFKIGVQALGWPQWQLLLGEPYPEADDHERSYVGPMCEALARWLPGEPRPELDAAVAGWRARNRG